MFNFVFAWSLGSDRCYQLLPPERWREGGGGDDRVREEEDLRWHRIFVQLIDCQCVAYFA